MMVQLVCFAAVIVGMLIAVVLMLRPVPVREQWELPERFWWKRETPAERKARWERGA